MGQCRCKRDRDRWSSVQRRKSPSKVKCIGYHGDRLDIALGWCHGAGKAGGEWGGERFELAAGLMDSLALIRRGYLLANESERSADGPSLEGASVE